MRILIAVFLLVFTSSVFAQDEAIETEVTWYKNFEKRKTTKDSEKAKYKETLKVESDETKERTVVRLSDGVIVYYSKQEDGFFAGKWIDLYSKSDPEDYTFEVKYCENEALKPQEERKNTILSRAESMDLLNIVYSKMRYPAVCREEHIEGEVVVKMWISKEGKLEEACIAESVHPRLDQESLRVVIKYLQNWNPKIENGEAIAFEFFLPVKYKLQD